MSPKEIKLIKDLLKHYDPELVADATLIKSFEKKYGAIRDILTQLLHKYEPTKDVSDKYLDEKLLSYGIRPKVARVLAKEAIQGYEYKSFYIKSKGLLNEYMDPEEIETVLNEYGAEGWELVSSLITNTHNAGSTDLLLILKRPLK